MTEGDFNPPPAIQVGGVSTRRTRKRSPLRIVAFFVGCGGVAAAAWAAFVFAEHAGLKARLSDIARRNALAIDGLDYVESAPVYDLHVRNKYTLIDYSSGDITETGKQIATKRGVVSIEALRQYSEVYRSREEAKVADFPARGDRTTQLVIEYLYKNGRWELGSVSWQKEQEIVRTEDKDLRRAFVQHE